MYENLGPGKKISSLMNSRFKSGLLSPVPSPLVSLSHPCLCRCHRPSSSSSAAIYLSHLPHVAPITPLHHLSLASPNEIVRTPPSSPYDPDHPQSFLTTRTMTFDGRSSRGRDGSCGGRDVLEKARLLLRSRSSFFPLRLTPCSRCYK